MRFELNKVYDTAKDTWSTAALMVVPRHGLAAVPVATGIMPPDGGTIQGSRRAKSSPRTSVVDQTGE